NGLEGVEADGATATVCCVSGCDPCGGIGCGGNSNTLSTDDCCIGEIVSSGQLCSDTGSAPCVLDTSTSTSANTEPAPTPTTQLAPTPSPSPTAKLRFSSAPTLSPVATVATVVPSSSRTLSPAAKRVPSSAPALSPTATPATRAPSPVSAPAASPPAIPASPPSSTSTSNSTPVVAGVASAVVAAALIGLGLCFWKRQRGKKKAIDRQTPLPVVVADRGNGSRAPHHHSSLPLPLYPHTLVAVVGTDGGGGGVVSPSPAALAGEVRAKTAPSTHTGKDGGAAAVAVAEGDADEGEEKISLDVRTSTTNTSTGERGELTPGCREGGVPGALVVDNEPKFPSEEDEASSSTGRRGFSGDLGLGHAVAEAAQELVRNCNIPGVTEVAAAVSILANLVTDNRDNTKSAEASLKRCRSIVMLLQRAARVLGKAGDTHGEAERVLMAEVHQTVSDLVELIKAYQSKNKLSKLLMSTLFRRREDEMGAIVDRAIVCMQFGLHVQVGNDMNTVRQDVSAVKQDVNAIKDGINLYKENTAKLESESLAETRIARRQRTLDQIEIPEEHVAITDELLGKGGFGEVYLADYNGRNAAAKIFYIDNSQGRRGENGILDGSKAGQPNQQANK
ncbi:unnamed protein product, partial [Laminaria digitata]